MGQQSSEKCGCFAGRPTLLYLLTGRRDFIKNSTEYPSACWRDKSGSPKGEPKEFALKG